MLGLIHYFNPGVCLQYETNADLAKQAHTRGRQVQALRYRESVRDADFAASHALLGGNLLMADG